MNEQGTKRRYRSKKTTAKSLGFDASVGDDIWGTGLDVVMLSLRLGVTPRAVQMYIEGKVGLTPSAVCAVEALKELNEYKNLCVKQDKKIRSLEAELFDIRAEVGKVNRGLGDGLAYRLLEEMKNAQ